MAQKLLHVGPGTDYKEQTTPVFNTSNWLETRLDIDPNVDPDILASITDMSDIEDNTFDAVFSSHNIEHIYAHDVLKAFNEFIRVLKDDGFLLLTCPDIQKVCKLIGDGRIGEKLYSAPAGDIYPLDVLYGWRQAIAKGHENMAHKNGFTSQSLIDHLRAVNFKSYITAQEGYNLWILAYKNIEKNNSEMEGFLKKHLGINE